MGRVYGRRRFHMRARAIGYDVEYRPVGQGAFGTVFRGVSHDGTKVVLKRMRNAGNNGETVLMSEASMLMHLAPHAHIVTLRDVLCVPPDFALVLDDAGLALDTVIRNRCLVRVSVIAHHLFSALTHCHACGIIHRDIKPANLAVSREGMLRVLDWGTSAGCEREGADALMTQAVGTCCYAAPEMLLSNCYGPAIDVWSAGCVIAEAIRGRRLFEENSEIGTVLAIFRLRGTPSATRWPATSQLSGFIEFESVPVLTRFPQWAPRDLARSLPGACAHAVCFLDGCLQCDASTRVSSAAMLRHAYLSKACALKGVWGLGV